MFSGAKYFARFREVVMTLLRAHNVSLFKFDGIGSLTSQRGDPAFAKDFSAMMKLLAEIGRAHV